ncbi:endospore germination permease [Tumebacillus sp. BK434]|uniref:GerAB/ArcD/ProY family transporter n=1 Tax=Tumebacillus sp. BK434 TaxID=2512169 RepID=UPI0014049247|nr:endospore germination permease [Tumebacillus sp. BK434]
MKKYAYNEITYRQYVFFLYKTQIGIGVLTLPRTVSEAAGTDGWIPILVGWAFVLLASWLIISVLKRHPQDTLYDLLPRYFGKWVGGLFNILWMLYGALGAAVILYATVNIMRMWIMPQTSPFWMVILLSIPLYTIGRNGLRVLGRFAEFVYFFTLWMYPLLLFSLPDSRLLHLLPVFKDGWTPFLVAFQTMMPSYLGFEMAFLLYPFLQEKQKALRGVVTASTMTMLLYLFIFLLCTTYFGPEALKTYVWPTLNLMKAIELVFVERFEIFFLSFYYIIVSMTIMPYLYLAVFGSSQLMGKQDHSRHLLVLLALIVLFFAVHPVNYEQSERWTKMFGRAGIGFAFVFPALLFAYVTVSDKMRGRKLS